MDGLPRDARQRVLDSAIEAFARKGYAGTSVRDIVTATGRSKPTGASQFFGTDLRGVASQGRVGGREGVRKAQLRAAAVRRA